MTKFDIFVEGFGNKQYTNTPLQLAVGVEAETFPAAVQKWYNALAEVSDVKAMYGPLTIQGDTVRLWGMKVFDNYLDALEHRTETKLNILNNIIDEL